MTSGTRQYVLFRVGAESYGLPIGSVSGVIRWEAATPVPRAPAAVEGVINLRGRVIPVVNLAKRLLGTALTPSSHSRIVVAESEAGAVGLAVDAALEVASINIDDIMPPPQTALSSETAEAFQGVVHHGDRLVILLDLDRALPRAEYEGAQAEQPEGEG
ncbi:MAG: chemotaxis protein CheW [Coriobacteriia bacterium]|nr:chemotaxis protein CheW [Coriobacteriia bacterium]